MNAIDHEISTILRGIIGKKRLLLKMVKLAAALTS
jgi:hypothetical protein